MTSSPGISPWLPVAVGPQREITSGTLDESEYLDTITLFVRGELAARFTVAAGTGVAVMGDCGLRRHQ